MDNGIIRAMYLLDKQKVRNVKMAVSGLGAVFVAEFCFNRLTAGLLGQNTVGV